MSVLMALPGCPAQTLHRDGSSLYPELPIKALLPAYALTVMIPLIDVVKDGGTIAFRLGTHRYIEDLEQSVPVSATLARGSFIVWNFEVIHGGEANRRDQPRPMLYMTLCRPFWTDMKNFGGTSRVRLAVDGDVIPLLNRRFARAADGGTWAHTGLGAVLHKINPSSPEEESTT
ncbi:MAG: phytanoyl-CoA dioxygenase family protein [Sphingomicrobium sp.]